MITINVDHQQSYVVTPSTDGTISTPDGIVICSFSAGTQIAFIAPCEEVQCSDDDALITRAFKFAPLGSSATGGGTSTYSTAVTPVLSGIAGGSTAYYELRVNRILSITLDAYNEITITGMSIKEWVADSVATAELWLNTSSTTPSITWPEDLTWIEGTEESSAPSLAADMQYRFVLRIEADGTKLINLSYSYALTTEEA